MTVVLLLYVTKSEPLLKFIMNAVIVSGGIGDIIKVEIVFQVCRYHLDLDPDPRIFIMKILI